MAQLSREEFNRTVVLRAARHAELLSEGTARLDIEHFHAEHVGVGWVGTIRPCRNAGAALELECCTALVEGLPLHPSQVLEIERVLTAAGPKLALMLWTTDDGMPWSRDMPGSVLRVTDLGELATVLLR